MNREGPNPETLLAPPRTAARVCTVSNAVIDV